MLNREAKRRNGGLGMNFRGSREIGVALAAQQGEWVSAQELSPVYLRPAQAERLRAERLNQENK